MGPVSAQQLNVAGGEREKNMDGPGAKHMSWTLHN